MSSRFAQKSDHFLHFMNFYHTSSRFNCSHGFRNVSGTSMEARHKTNRAHGGTKICPLQCSDCLMSIQSPTCSSDPDLKVKELQDGFKPFFLKAF